MVCGVFQLAAVKVRLAWLTVASPKSPLDTSIITSEAGCALRTTVNSSVVPVSETDVFPSLWVTVKPTASSSIVVTVKVWSATGSKRSLLLASLIERVMVVF